MEVRAKKALGQHFLKDMDIAARIADSLEFTDGQRHNLIEVGPGTGVLTQFLYRRDDVALKLAEIDSESVEYLRLNYPELGENLIFGDFLKMDLDALFSGEEFCVIGNFPYNISSQIFFKILDYRRSVPQVVGMIQKEVAERLASPPGSKVYGILSVLLQAWYEIEYLFTVPEHVFLPPPKVKSAVIRLKRNSRTSLGCDEELFRKVVKACFNQRRKTIRNSIRAVVPQLPKEADHPLLSMRPEQLGVEEFVELTNAVAEWNNF